MTAQTQDVAEVRTGIEVAAPPERAFEVFTAGLDGWWPRGHHVQSGELKRVGVDPAAGGRVWEESETGEVCAWGEVLVWDPPATFAFSWRLGPDFGVPTADSPASRVTVTFTPTDGGTRVELVHDRLDAHGPGWQRLRDGVGGDGGWPDILRNYAAAAGTEPAEVRSSIEVAAPPERAFEVFTAGIDRWWTRAHHVQAGELKEIGVDPVEGGRLWEENDAGEVCTWGRVLVWQPPSVFAFSWLIGPDWGVPAPDAPGSRVTVTFTPIPTGTRVDLAHDRFEVHGPGWEGVRDGVASDGGWPAGLRQFAAAAQA